MPACVLELVAGVEGAEQINGWIIGDDVAHVRRIAAGVGLADLAAALFSIENAPEVAARIALSTGHVLLVQPR